MAFANPGSGCSDYSAAFYGLFAGIDNSHGDEGDDDNGIAQIQNAGSKYMPPRDYVMASSNSSSASSMLNFFF